MSTDSNEDETLEAISKHERNKKIREGHREIAEALKQDTAILIRRSEFTSASDVLTKLSSISKTLKKKQECLAALDENIVQKCGISEINKEIAEATETSAKIEETLSKIEEFMKGAYGANPIAEASPRGQSGMQAITPPRTGVLQANSPASRSSSSRTPSIGVKLPKIALPRFYGEITKFQSFWKNFESAVHENDLLTDGQKLTYI